MIGSKTRCQALSSGNERPLFSRQANGRHEPEPQLMIAQQVLQALGPVQAKGYFFLGIVNLPLGLECRGMDLYQMINDRSSPLRQRQNLAALLESLDHRESEVLTEYIELVTTKTWLFFKLPDSSLALVIVSTERVTLFWQEQLDWHNGRGLLLAGVALIIATLEADNAFQSVGQVESCQVVDSPTYFEGHVSSGMLPHAYHDTSESAFAILHCLAWASSSYKLTCDYTPKLVGLKFGHERGYICVERDIRRTLAAFIP